MKKNRHRSSNHAPPSYDINSPLANVAVIAAEAAASNILSDAPISRSRFRSRPGSFGTNGGGGNNGGGNNTAAAQSGSSNGGTASPNASFGSGSGPPSSQFMESLRRQQASIMQQQYRREKVFSAKRIEMFLAFLVVVAIGMFVFEDEQRQHYHSHSSSALAGSGGSDAGKLGVPLPPSVERAEKKIRQSNPAQDQSNGKLKDQIRQSIAVKRTNEQDRKVKADSRRVGAKSKEKKSVAVVSSIASGGKASGVVVSSYASHGKERKLKIEEHSIMGKKEKEQSRQSIRGERTNKQNKEVKADSRRVGAIKEQNTVTGVSSIASSGKSSGGKVKSYHLPGNEKEMKIAEDSILRKERIEATNSSTSGKGMRSELGQDRAVPPILIFTYHTDLLATSTADLAGDEDAALAANVRNIISLHPNATVRFLTDDDCVASIRAALGDDDGIPLADYFANETRGMYKADICRGAALYETGGMYFDVDIDARISLWDVVRPETDFVTTLVHKDSKHHGGFFQAFIGVAPRREVMRRYLELFIQYYRGDLKVDGPLGVILLRRAYDELSAAERRHAELWQEMRYNPDVFSDVPRPKGARRACQMLVVAPMKVDGRGHVVDWEVPFYSHMQGSRMCGGKDTKKKGR